MFKALPQTIYLQGECWKIREETLAESKRSRSVTRRGLYGVTMPHAREIIVQHGMTQEQRDTTILHELMHAAYASSRDEMLGHALEEHIVATLEEPLYKALKQMMPNDTDR